MSGWKSRRDTPPPATPLPPLPPRAVPHTGGGRAEPRTAAGRGGGGGTNPRDRDSGVGGRRALLPSGGLGEPGSGLSGSRWVCSSLIKVGAAAGSVGRGSGCEGGVGGSLGAGRV